MPIPIFLMLIFFLNNKIVAVIIKRTNILVLPIEIKAKKIFNAKRKTIRHTFFFEAQISSNVYETIQNTTKNREVLSIPKALSPRTFALRKAPYILPPEYVVTT